MEERQYTEAKLIAELEDPNFRRKCGVPHPLSNFALTTFVDGAFADIVSDFIGDTVFYESNSPRHQGARWFLLDSNAFFDVCGEAGLDGKRLRKHLRRKLNEP